MFYIYKITNDINDKVYIGQTTRTLEERWQGHISRYNANNSNIHLYNAMHKYGIEHFKIELLDDSATTKLELDELEKYYIQKYNSCTAGYNMTAGGDANPMFSPKAKENHDIICKTDTFRNNVSKGMKEYREKHQFTEEHRKKLSEAMQGNHNFGSGDTRSIGCYCIDSEGQKHEFHSYLDGGKWWFENYHPFGEKYVPATFRRRIYDSIHGKDIYFSKYENGTRIKIKIDNIKWYNTEGGDINEVN